MVFYRKYTLVIGAILVLVPSILQVEACIDVTPVGVGNKTIISDAQMTASSRYIEEEKEFYIPSEGRLFAPTAWCPATLGGDDWLQIDMGSYYNVCSIATQGKQYGSKEWTTNYTLSVSRDGIYWAKYTENNQLKVFDGNVDVSSVVRHNINPVWTRYVRFYPKGYKKWPCLRVEIYIELRVPVITVKPVSQTIAVGQHLLLNCSSKGSPKPQVTWTLNGNDVIFGHILFNGSLLVKSVENDKYFEGNYRCIATNSAGYATSDAMVTIHEKPKVFNTLGAYSSYLRGSTAVLSCYGLGDPSPTITWTKDGSTHIPRGEFHDHSHVLVIYNVSARDQGVYRCVVSNSLGEAMSSTNLTLIDRPSIDTVRTRSTIQASRRQTVNVGCYGNSILPLMYTWSKDKVAVTDGNHDNSTVRVFGNLLVITLKEPRDYGTYVCHVNNSVDTATFDIEVIPLEQGTNHSVRSSHTSGPSGPSGPSGQCEVHLGFIIVLVLALMALLASFAFNIHQYRRMKYRNADSTPISLNEMNACMKDWENLIPEENEGIDKETEQTLNKQ